jgi:glucose-1-phosphate thymidylyltransferase
MIAGRPAIEHIINRVEEIPEIDEILVVTNEKFFKQFQDWQGGFSSKKAIKVLSDKTLTEDDRLGAIGDIDFVISREKISEDLLVIAGDNLFQLGLREFVDFAVRKLPAFSIGTYNLKDKEAVKRYSQVTVDADSKIIKFEEKPRQPSATLVAKCIYFFPKDKLDLISEYVNSGNSVDAPGHYISWLCRKYPVYAFTFTGMWYDIGDVEIYKRADRDFAGKGRKGER